MSLFQEYVAETSKNPPDPNGPIPMSNRHATMYGATIPFHALAWVAVLLRLYTRFKLVREPGWDDYTIILATIFNLVGMVGFIGAINSGLGEHLLFLGEGTLISLMKYFYLNTAAYIACAGLVKLSLLCQYLRMFRQGVLRMICIVALVAASIWAIYWNIQGWFPCFPVSGFWNRMQPAKCWGLGYSDKKAALMAMYAFATTNMVLDVVIFAIPMTVYMRPGIKRKEVFALMALFTLGSVVVLMAILRLWTTVGRDYKDPMTMDFSWWYPTPMTLGCIEIDFAIICASIPIFWPVMVDTLPQIFVTKEVRVTHHQRIHDFEMDRPHSLKSNNSQEGLTRAIDLTKTNYRDQFVVDHVTGKQNTEVVIGGKADNKWYR